MDYRDTYRNCSVMITGGLGFIGSNLAHALVDLGAKVTLVDSMIDDYGGNMFNIAGIEDRVKVNIADVRDESGMRYLVRRQHFIFSLAGQVSHLDSMKDPYTDLEINCRSQLSLLEACRKFNQEAKIVFAATRQQYGKPEYLPVDENHPMRPVDVNGINKIAGEYYYILYNNVYGIRACSLRLTNTYGPRQLMKHDRHGFVGVFVRQAINGEKIRIFGDGEQRRDYNYVDDVVRAFLIAAASPKSDGEVFNLGSDEVVTHSEFVKLLLELAGQGSCELVPFPGDLKRIDIGDYFGSFDKIKRTLGWQPQIRLREGLTKMIEFYCKHKREYWPQ